MILGVYHLRGSALHCVGKPVIDMTVQSGAAKFASSLTVPHAAYSTSYTNTHAHVHVQYEDLKQPV